MLCGEFYENCQSKCIEEHIWLGALDKKSLALCVLGFKNIGPQFRRLLLSIRYHVRQNTQFPKSIYRSACTHSLVGNDVKVACLYYKLNKHDKH